MDPRKNYICSKGHRYNDTQKLHGHDVECPICNREQFEATIKKKPCKDAIKCEGVYCDLYPCFTHYGPRLDD